VFNTIHNVQQNTPPENIAAAYEAARQAGGYPLAGSDRPADR
jgi:uroporphyrinogen-III decarboxylase